jgi:hypothetical protein
MVSHPNLLPLEQREDGFRAPGGDGVEILVRGPRRRELWRRGRPFC